MEQESLKMLAYVDPCNCFEMTRLR